MKVAQTIIQALLFLVPPASALTPAEWRTQSVYQIMTDRFARSDGSTAACNDLGNYCGGTYQGIINKLDYIQDMGFTAIWISPVVKNIDTTPCGTPYHGYHQTDLYDVNTNFGTSQDLVALSDALHERGMYLMVDVVTNHMAQEAGADAIDYAKFHPFDDQSYYHAPCSIDTFGSNSTNLEQCWFATSGVALADLRTEDKEVQDTFNTWISQLINNYTIDGLRIDSARHVDPGSIASLQAAAGGMHVLAEVWDGNPTSLCGYQDWMTGMMNFPQYYRIYEAFSSTGGSMTGLRDGVNNMKSACKDVTVLGSFMENHDTKRFANYTSDLALIRNALAFTMLQDGIPIIYQGQEQRFSGGDDPENREFLGASNYNQESDLYLLTKKLNAIRSWAIEQDPSYITYNAEPVYADEKTIIMRKGQMIGIFTNRGEDAGDATMTLSQSNFDFDASQAVMDVIACKTLTTDSEGNLEITITKGEPIVLYPVDALKESGICGQ